MKKKQKKIKINIDERKNKINKATSNTHIYIIIALVVVILDIYLVFQFSTVQYKNPGIDFMELFQIFTEESTKSIDTSLIFNKEVWSNFFYAQKNLVIVYVLGIMLILMKILEPKEEFKGMEHGSANWAKKKDYARFINPKNTIVLADKLYLDTKDSEADNFNEMIIGGSGAGKSWRKIKPDILQMVGSYVVTDPKGELYRDTCKVLEKNGYKVKVLNVLQPKYSNGYNPFRYINKETLETDVLSLVNCFMKNTSDSKKQGGDQFWDDSMKALLTAIVFYLVLEENEEKTFERVFDLVRKVSVDEETGDIDESKTELERIFNKVRVEQPYHPGLQAYEEFKLASGKTAKSILISLAVRLNIFINSDICAMTYEDEMELEKIGTEKTAIFLITPDTDETFNVLVSMFYTQLFKVLFYEADFKHNGKLPYLVSCELDEFANIGEIPNFDKYIATMRSRNVRVAIILQALSQLEKLYKESWETILGCCYIFNYLGTTDQKTQKYVNEKLGKTTILSKNRGTSRSAKSSSSNENNNLMARDLMTVTEISQLDKKNSIVFVRGVPPFFAEKFKTQFHPLIGYVGSSFEKDFKNNTNIIERYKEIAEEKLAKLGERRKEKYEKEKVRLEKIERANEEKERLEEEEARRNFEEKYGAE